MTDKDISFNKGEWSEVYAFIKLLKDGRIYAADRFLNKMDENLYLPIIKIYEEEGENSVYEYFTATESDRYVKIYHNKEFVKKVKVEDFDLYAAMLYHALATGKTGNIRLGDIGNLEKFLKDICHTKLKAGSKKKADIVLELMDVHTGFRPKAGFSIKSQLGAPSTLLNASSSTNFVYRITGIDDKVMDEVNNINTRTKIIDRMKMLENNGGRLELDHVSSETFADNLEMIDSSMAKILGNLLVYRYSEGILESDKLVEKLCERNPLGYRKNDIYQYKYKKLLCAFALGMLPASPWDGIDEANGGYIIVKADGDVLAYYLYNRNEFEDYLLRNTKLEAASTSRHNYASIYKKEGTYYINLNLQIRFRV